MSRIAGPVQLNFEKWLEILTVLGTTTHREAAQKSLHSCSQPACAHITCTMLRFITNPFLLGVGAGVFACYPAVVDKLTQFISHNQLLDSEDAYVCILYAHFSTFHYLRHYLVAKESGEFIFTDFQLFCLFFSSDATYS